MLKVVVAVDSCWLTAVVDGDNGQQLGMVVVILVGDGKGG
jgi:hypothetical protein